MSEQHSSGPSTAGATPLVSVVVPTYNEARDIRRTLDALVAQTYPAVEVLAVDDSTDETPRIVESFASRGVRLYPGPRRGRNEARNLGILRARGSIVVILNADVFPGPDFIERIVRHYQQGADYVLVESCVGNTDAMIPRYLQAWHRLTYGGQDWIEWTEGFSCRRAAALDVGLFPEAPLPLCSGEDVDFALRLARRYRKVIDRSIVVPHMVPDTIRGLWNQQSTRGRGIPRRRFFIVRQTRLATAARAFAKTLRAVLTVGSVVPLGIMSARLCRHSARGFRDSLGFCAVLALHTIAQVYGEWAGVWDILRYRAPNRE